MGALVSIASRSWSFNYQSQRVRHSLLLLNSRCRVAWPLGRGHKVATRQMNVRFGWTIRDAERSPIACNEASRCTPPGSTGAGRWTDLGADQNSGEVERISVDKEATVRHG